MLVLTPSVRNQGIVEMLKKLHDEFREKPATYQGEPLVEHYLTNAGALQKWRIFVANNGDTWHDSKDNTFFDDILRLATSQKEEMNSKHAYNMIVEDDTRQ